jgi:SAM-dependent methyltransferase
MRRSALHPAEPRWTRGWRFARCPVCGSRGFKQRFVSADSPFIGKAALDYVRCAVCAACFVPGFEPPHYGAAAPLMTRFYVEQGAGIDTMIEPLFSVPHQGIRNYLEIGCGYGFSVDFARRSLGWNASGVDPSANAVEGKRVLGASIEDRPWSGGDAGPVDLLYSSETIEHLPDPPAFLAAAARQLASGGLLLLTTPNAEFLVPSSTPFTNFAILSAGYHCVLFTRAAMERALAAAGFKHARLWQRGFTLLALASVQPLPPAQPDGAYRAPYQNYLRERLASIPAATPLATGLAYRLFKDLVNVGAYAEAEQSLARVLLEADQRFNLDLQDPLAIDAANFFTEDGAASFVPFNAAGCFYFQGMLELNHRGNWRRAEEHFAAAHRAAGKLRGMLRAIGTDDGETEDLERQALRHQALAHSRGNS